MTDSNLQHAIREAFEKRPPRPGPAFEVICHESTPEDIEAGRLRVSIKLDLTLCPALFGCTAGELREMGYLKDNNIPDCATLGPDGFTWVEMNFTLTPDGVES